MVNLTETFLEGARDWRLSVDLDRRLKVPEQVAKTELRPDMLLISEATKKMGVVELTVPNEERIEISNELKQNKYAALKVEGGRNGWKVKVWAVEVGCRGFPAASLSNFLKEIGVEGRGKIMKKVGETAERSSKWLWNCSRCKEWGKHN